ncbi:MULTISPECIES: hypothetical protein [Alteromonadales]|uniref:hypothetical protein n=1 Tax=Alteromonadales TaxID=135622 RepID=UPI00258022F4|nr:MULTISPECIES: hypothetical protein [Alteromonadales]
MKRTNYEFSLTILGVDESTPNIDDLLYESACCDGLICYYGKAIYIDFHRKADNYLEAITSAIKDIEAAHIDARVSCVDAGDYVGLADIAELSDVTRSSIKQLIDGIRGSCGFPDPVQRLQGKHPLWRWSGISMVIN